MKIAHGLGLLLILLAILGPSGGRTESVAVTVPANLSFFVQNINNTTTGTPSPFRISFTDADLNPGNNLRISVRANDAAFTPPSGNSIAVAKVSWTIAGAVNGAGTPGTLSDLAFTQLYQSAGTPQSGSVDLTWRLAAPGAGIRAGNHSLTVTWKIESIGL